jgi:hypothetical protein
MAVTIARWGNGAGLHLSKDLLERARLKIGDAVQLDVRGNGITISPAYRSNSEKIEALFANYPGEPYIGETDWGHDVGKEKIE